MSNLQRFNEKTGRKEFYLDEYIKKFNELMLEIICDTRYFSSISNLI